MQSTEGSFSNAGRELDSLQILIARAQNVNHYGVPKYIIASSGQNLAQFPSNSAIGSTFLSHVLTHLRVASHVCARDLVSESQEIVKIMDKKIKETLVI